MRVRRVGQPRPAHKPAVGTALICDRAVVAWALGSALVGPRRVGFRLILAPDDETAALLSELDAISMATATSLSPRIQLLKRIVAKIRPEPVSEPLPPLRTAASDRPETAPRVNLTLG